MVLGLVILVGLSTALLYQTDLGTVAVNHLMVNLRVGPLIAAFGLISMAFFFMALRWRALMPPEHNPPALGLSAMICTGLLFNYTVPGPVGEFGSAWFAHRRYRIPMSDALASGITARLVGLATAGTLAGLAWSLGDLQLDSELTTLTQVNSDRLRELGLAMSLVAAAATFFIIRPSWWAVVGAIALRPLCGDSRFGMLMTRIAGFVQELAESVSAVRDRGVRPLSMAAFWALCGHASVVAGIWVAAASLGAQPSLQGLIFTYGTATSLAMALFAFPGSQLGWDLLFGGLLMLTAGLGNPTLIGEPDAYLATVEGTAAAIVLLVRLQQLCFMLLGAAVVAWLIEGELSGEPPVPG